MHFPYGGERLSPSSCPSRQYIGRNPVGKAYCITDAREPPRLCYVECSRLASGHMCPTGGIHCFLFGKTCWGVHLQRHATQLGWQNGTVLTPAGSPEVSLLIYFGCASQQKVSFFYLSFKKYLLGCTRSQQHHAGSSLWHAKSLAWHVGTSSLRGIEPRPLYLGEGSQPLYHQGSPRMFLLEPACPSTWGLVKTTGGPYLPFNWTGYCCY